MRAGWGFLLSIALCCVLQAAPHPEVYQCLTPDQQSIDLNRLNYLASLRPEATLRPEKYIPVHMAPSTDISAVGNNILLHTLKNNAYLRERIDGLNKWANFSHEVRISSAPSPAEQSASPNSVSSSTAQKRVEHKLKTSLHTTTAKVAYSGYVNAELSYSIDRNQLHFQVRKKINKTTTLAFHVEQLDTEQRELLKLQWAW